jgi:glycerol kinase
VVADTTALGAAYLAGLAEGVWDSVDDITNNWAIDVTITPREDPALANALHQQWLRAIERSRDWI